jgi:hypothetical protein
MSKNRTLPKRHHLSSLLLIAPLAGFGCASRIQLGETDGGAPLGSTGGAGSVLPGVGGGVGTGGGANFTTGGGPTVVPGLGTVVTENLNNNAIKGIDLLLMIDNSSSMADKQLVLANAVPQLLGQLVQPQCVDSNGNPTGAVATLGAGCSIGSPEFNPVNNIHIGIVTSSLGDHGAGKICTPGLSLQYTDAAGNNLISPPDLNDEGHLVGSLARATAAQADPQSVNAGLDGQGFLAWGSASLPNPTAGDLTAANQIFKDLVIATHENGCGFESQLEGWFRFLIDPVPPIEPIQKNPNTQFTARVGSDDILLNQRAVFLRPDSLVAIVMLTDENDCSLRDTDVGWVAADTSNSILSSSPACATNPNDRCCYSCTSGAPAGCAPCANPAPVAVDDAPNQANIRCWQQKRRFGYEFMYPTSRYVVGLTKPVLCPDQSFGDMDCDCEYANKIGAPCDPGSRQLPNPLYSTIAGQLNNGNSISQYPKSIARSDNSAIFFAAIVGVPWQDIGTTDASGNLKYIPVTDPAWYYANSDTQPNNPGPNGIWSQIYGDDNANILPDDIHMVESLTPRAGIAGPTAAAGTDPINGHEYNTARGDLEYACTYALPTPKPCACTPGSANYASCKYQNPNDCCDLTYTADYAGNPNSGANFDKPLCGGADGRTQIAAKAYPGLREIAVLRDYAQSNNVKSPGNSIVASICPKDLTSAQTSPGYGYNPVVGALIDRLKEKLKGSCLPTSIATNSNGTVPCDLVEAVPQAIVNARGSDCATYCSANQRSVVTASSPLGLATTSSMVQNRICGGSTGNPCSSMCLCQLSQETGAALATCQNATDGSESALPPGFCYVDATVSPAIGNAALLAWCPDTARRILRFVGNNLQNTVPLAGSYVFTTCSASAWSQ